MVEIGKVLIELLANYFVIVLSVYY